MSTALDPARGSDRARRLPPDERRDLLLDAAARLFARQPYAEVSTTAIAREAGVARGLLNHYFRDKRGLYLEVVRRAVLLPVLAELPTTITGPVEERVEVAVRWFLDSVEPQVASYLTVVGSEGLGDDPEVAGILAEADDLAARRVLQLMGLDADDDLARTQVRCYGGLAKATVREWARDGHLDRPQAHRLLREVLLLLVRDVLPHP
ncbi:TetR/AcrR family transcriptional regulator [Nocardioides sp.]|uniref:TetR/AcrR family transcriptional regulator n=1 Tax=Nocardioides sp. TaxID=35761 RepID=UPI003512A4BD